MKSSPSGGLTRGSTSLMAASRYGRRMARSSPAPHATPPSQMEWYSRRAQSDWVLGHDPGQNFMAKSTEVSRGASSGGRAEAAGGNYETLVASWCCVRLLASTAGEPPADLPANGRLVS